MMVSIQLRELRQTDWQAVHRYASLEIVSRYQPWGPNSEEETRQYVDEVLRDAAKKDRTRFTFAVILEGELIGCGELTICDRSNLTGEIGYILHPEHWGKGIATLLAKKLLNIAFHEHGLHRIQATCDPANAGSIRVLEKCGMTREGRIRDHLKMNDGWRDSLLFGKLEHE
ncbi:GNAT family N-acetyltransferase [Rossellomorea marisflavi]|uniref:Acetyltransferase n=1 Tax=Rossellomorea marisflavi TaxID=189381 RepID=A0A163MSX0_9BACI|nr:GNAT family protein [Rossellomorea marisflavi]KZE53317.1 acetyltransferase [Rossellomorea marisflavi]